MLDLARIDYIVLTKYVEPTVWLVEKQRGITRFGLARAALAAATLSILMSLYVSENHSFLSLLLLAALWYFNDLSLDAQEIADAAKGHPYNEWRERWGVRILGAVLMPGAIIALSVIRPVPVGAIEALFLIGALVIFMGYQYIISCNPPPY